MSLVEIMLKTDDETKPVKEIGSIVVPANSTVKLESPAMEGIEKCAYSHAIIISMTPFILVSEYADMRWERTVKTEDFIPIGKVKADVLELCKTRTTE